MKKQNQIEVSRVLEAQAHINAVDKAAALESRAENARAEKARAKEKRRAELREKFPEIFLFVQQLKDAGMFWLVGKLEGRGENIEVDYDDRVLCSNCLRHGSYSVREKASNGRWKDTVLTGCKLKKQGVYEKKHRCKEFLDK